MVPISGIVSLRLAETIIRPLQEATKVAENGRWPTKSHSESGLTMK